MEFYSLRRSSVISLGCWVGLWNRIPTWTRIRTRVGVDPSTSAHWASRDLISDAPESPSVNKVWGIPGKRITVDTPPTLALSETPESTYTMLIKIPFRLIFLIRRHYLYVRHRLGVWLRGMQNFRCHSLFTAHGRLNAMAARRRSIIWSTEKRFSVPSA